MTLGCVHQAMLGNGGAQCLHMAPSPCKQRLTFPRTHALNSKRNVLLRIKKLHYRRKISRIPLMPSYRPSTALAAASPSPTLQTAIEFKFTVKNTCELVISGELSTHILAVLLHAYWLCHLNFYSYTLPNLKIVYADGPEGMGAASLVALYHYYLSRSKNLAAAVLLILEKHPDLVPKLGHGGANIKGEKHF